MRLSINLAENIIIYAIYQAMNIVFADIGIKNREN
jgi:hypothetical protein